MALLQKRSTLIRPSLTSLATLLFSRLARGLLLKFSRPLMLFDNNESNHGAVIKRQPRHIKIQKYPISFKQDQL